MIHRRCKEIMLEAQRRIGKPARVGHLASQNGVVTHTQVGALLGVSRHTVMNIISGRNTIGTKLALEIERETGISADHIVKAAALDLLDYERAKRGQKRRSIITTLGQFIEQKMK